MNGPTQMTTAFALSTHAWIGARVASAERIDRQVVRGMLALVAMFVAVLAAAPVAADERAVKRLIESRIGDAKVIEVRKLAHGDLYEVALRSPEGVRVIYSDSKARVILVGNLLDGVTGENLTEARVRKLTAIDWKTLPLEWAITMKRGTGRREIAVFSDPNCPFCERFERGLEKVEDITVHIFMYPVIKPDSMRQARAVWCSRDRAKAWNDLMFKRVEPLGKPDCDTTPVDRLVALGKKLGAVSTPTWFLRDGEMRTGAMTMADLVPLLDEQLRRQANAAKQ